MKFVPQIIGAVVLVALGGAVSGAHIGTSPVLEREAQESLPEAPIITASNVALNAPKRTPNHYPLETPKGIVPVSELALNGRLKDSAQAHWWREERGAGTDLAASYDIEYDDQELYRMAREEAVIAYTASAAPAGDKYREMPGSDYVAAHDRQDAGSTPLAPTARAQEQTAPLAPASSRGIGNAKVIDVAAALESQGK